VVLVVLGLRRRPVGALREFRARLDKVRDVVQEPAVPLRAALAIVMCIVAAGPLSAGQAAPGTANKSPRTPWGDPDLQGVWDYWTLTPLERPKEFVNKPMLTDQEATALAKRLRDQAVAGDSVRPGAGNPGGYSQEAWTDRARGTVLNQTSLIVDPEDGRIPPLSPEGQKTAEAHRAAGGHPVRMRTDGIGYDDPEDRGLSERCLLAAPGRLQPGGALNVQIVRAQGVVLLEMNLTRGSSR
jgi:hypothetical protein